MRITVTVDPDTEKLIRNAMRKRGSSFNEALNDAIRAGLTKRKQSGAPRFMQKSFRLGAEQNFSWDKALAAAEAMEDEELSRKLALRK